MCRVLGSGLALCWCVHFKEKSQAKKNRAEEVEISPTLFPSVKSLGAETGELNHAEGLLALDSALSPAGFITG